MINWNMIEKSIIKLQLKIAKAYKNQEIEKVKKLQRILVRTHEARLMAIKIVKSSSGSKTPGVDGIKIVKEIDNTDELYIFLKDLTNYKSNPVKRVGIPKTNGKIRYLGIPTIKDRCMQALFTIALFPVSEMTADRNSFGFRPMRSTKDAIEHLYKSQFEKGKTKPTINWVLDADIKGFFDNISHNWILENILIEKRILKEFLEAGYISPGFDEIAKTESGVPQGGIISPMIANITLDGLEDYIKKGLQKRNVFEKTIFLTSYVRYADDFIIIGPYKWIVERCLEIVEEFLADKGLELNKEKSKIINSIETPIKYLGFSIIRAKDGRSFVIPDPEKVKNLVSKISEIIRKANTMKEIIEKLNPILRGWANYYKSCSAHETFTKVDAIIFNLIMKWGSKRLLTRSKATVIGKYFANDFNEGFKILRPYYKDERGKRVPLYICRYNKIMYHKINRKTIFDELNR